MTLSSTGWQQTPPATLRAELIAIATAEAPGLTTELPGSLIEDMASTAVGALAVIDSAKVDLLNSFAPTTANDFILYQLGATYGVTQGYQSNASVNVVFSGTVGFVIPVGFTVSDGTNQYVIQDGGIIGSNGQSLPLFALATQYGTWAIPPGSVTALATSVPGTITLSVTNPAAGTPASAAQTSDQYRAQVLQAGLAPAIGTIRYLKTQLLAVPGVQARLLSVLQNYGGGWQIIVGGGDPYQVAGAIFNGVFDVSTLSGSILAVTNITQAEPAVITTNLTHGYTTGQVISIQGALGMTEVNSIPYTATVIDAHNFSIPINTAIYPAYTGGGVLTPNFRNTYVSVNDYPNTYVIPIVIPPQQVVTIELTWNTSATNFISDIAIQQLAQPAIAAYVNSITGGAPMLLNLLQDAFIQSIASVVAPQFINRMIFVVNIDGVTVTPEAGTNIIAGDPESYLYALTTGITVTRG